MATSRYSGVLRIAPLILIVCLCSLGVYAQYSGGSGKADDPYRIATAEELMLLGETPEDYDMHFSLDSTRIIWYKLE